MVVQQRRDGYASGRFVKSENAVAQDEFTDEHGILKSFVLARCERQSEAEGASMSYLAWASRVADRERRITDEVKHFSSKFDLARQAWRNWRLKLM